MNEVHKAALAHQISIIKAFLKNSFADVDYDGISVVSDVLMLIQAPGTSKT